MDTTERVRSTPRGGGGVPPLHPFLNHIPLVLLPASFVCDVVHLTGRPAFRPVADGLLLAGLIAVIPAALAGIWDLFRQGALRPPRRATAVTHVGTQVVASAVFLVSWLLRVGDWEGIGDAYSLSVALSGIATLTMLVGGWLGGRLVFRHGVGVAREARFEIGVIEVPPRAGETDREPPRPLHPPPERLPPEV